MVEQETYNPYTLADIERYLQGKMTAAEMHAMEKAALQDPFLSDAIEGYSQAPLSEAHTHLNEIAAALYGDKQEAKVVAMPAKKSRWVNWGAAAAAVVAVVIAVLFVTTASENNKAKDMAARQTNIPVFTDTAKTQQAVTDTPLGGLIANIPQKDNTKAKKGDSTADGYYANNNNNAQAIASNDIVSAKPKAEEQADKVVTLNDTTYQLRAPLTFARAKTLNKAKRLDNGYYNNAVGNAVDNNAILSNKQSGPSYQQNNLNIQQQVTVNTTTVAAANADTLNKMLAGRTAGLIVTMPDKEVFLPPSPNTPPTSDKLAPLGNVAKRANPMQIVLTPIPNFDTVAITYLNNKNKSPKMVIDSSLSPQGGWESFRDYVVKRLDKNMDTTDLAEGDVELEFTIDDRGLARDIKVTRSLDMSHDAQAAELVKKWPGWVTSKKQKKGKVVIQF